MRTSELLYYPFPLVNWFDLVLPQLIRDLRQGPDDPYWFAHQTEAYEVALYIGTIPLILVFLAIFSRREAAQPCHGKSRCRSALHSPP